LHAANGRCSKKIAGLVVHATSRGSPLVELEPSRLLEHVDDSV
jgi:hypothetical protein